MVVDSFLFLVLSWMYLHIIVYASSMMLGKWLCPWTIMFMRYLFRSPYFLSFYDSMRRVPISLSYTVMSVYFSEHEVLRNVSLA